MRKAKEMIFTGDPLTGVQAAEYGLANYSVPADELEEFTTKLANRVALVPPALLALHKRQINRTYEIMGIRTALSAGNDIMALNTHGGPFIRPCRRRACALRSTNATHDGVRTARRRCCATTEPAYHGPEVSIANIADRSVCCQWKHRAIGGPDDERADHDPRPQRLGHRRRRRSRVEPVGLGGDARAKVLATGDGYYLALVEAEPGYHGDPHEHAFAEMLYVLSGRLHTQGVEMGPGDTFTSRPPGRCTPTSRPMPAPRTCRSSSSDRGGRSYRGEGQAADPVSRRGSAG